MTRDDIDVLWHRATVDTLQAGELYSRYRFAELVAAIEREACADLCEKTTAMWAETHFNDGCTGCAEAIRARGGSKPQGGGR